MSLDLGWLIWYCAHCLFTPDTVQFYELLLRGSLEQTPYLNPFYWWDCYKAINPTTHSTPFILKLSLCLATLIVIRGGVPRYRYDLLTKMGWTKFLLLVLAVLLSTLFLLYLM